MGKGKECWRVRKGKGEEGWRVRKGKGKEGRRERYLDKTDPVVY